MNVRDTIPYLSNPFIHHIINTRLGGFSPVHIYLSQVLSWPKASENTLAVIQGLNHCLGHNLSICMLALNVQLQFIYRNVHKETKSTTKNIYTDRARGPNADTPLLSSGWRQTD